MTLHRFTLQLSDGSKREFLHRGTKADHGVIQQMFKSQDYSLHKLGRGREIFQLYQAQLAAGLRPLILDAGSNIGASIVWFSITFPGAHIVGIEPDADNYALLQKNTVDLNVDIYQAAIGSQDAKVSLVDPGEGEWGYRTELDVNGLTKMIGAGRLLADMQQQGYVPFLVKIDIEGGERELFSANVDWIDSFPILIIELHDWLLPKQRTSEIFLKAISSRNRDFLYFGENVFSIKN